MPPTNDFLPFCPTDTGTNLLSESDYLASSDRVSGNKPGIASGRLNNRAIRQANAIASQIAQYVADKTGTDVVDDADFTKLQAQLVGAMTPFAPNLSKFTSGSGTFKLTYIFMIASGNATAGATYTNNTVTFTVVSTIVSGTILKATGSGDPSLSGTLTKASGSGDATLTFYTSRKAAYLRVVVAGGGGGGAAGNNSSNGSDGNDSSFGTTLIVAGKGSGGVFVGATAAGGTASLGSGPVGLALAGGGGQGSSSNGPSGIFSGGGNGGSNALGGNGAGGYAANAPTAGAAGTGAGGGGGGSVATSGAVGGGGGAGGYVSALILSPASSYAYVVGAGGAGGSAGGSGIAGGAGGAGVVEVIEFYQ